MSKMRALGVLCLLALGGLAPAVIPARAESLSGFSVSAGSFRVLDDKRVAEAGLELRCALVPIRWMPRAVPGFVPAAGVMVNSDGSFYAYGSFRFEIAAGRLWQITPQVGAGIYARNGGFNLGGPVEFRSGLEVTRQIGDRHRLGLLFYHLSNAVLYRHNPGSESLVLTFSTRR
ncbi:MAG: lipid 3-O-deacylase [Acidobacteriota bacterium]|nr:lipid 3-O-deacylase [Acidobacteriota bacterium]